MRQMKDSGIEWIGQIPEEWEINPLLSLFKERKCKNINLKESNVLSLSYGKIIKRDVETNMGLLPESFETYNIVEYGNIILRLTDLQNDKTSLRTGLVTRRGIITSAYITIESKNDVQSSFFSYLLHTYDILKVFYMMGNGVRQNLKFAELSRLPLLIPPLNEQQRIADYLDAQCARIDETMELVRQSKEKLRAYKLSLITEAVTKGLDPDVPMKDSGIPWIGEIPAGWEVVPLKKQLDSIVDYRGKTPEKTEFGIFLVTAKNIKNGKIDYSLSQEYVSEKDYLSIMRRGLPKKGDLLFTTEAPLGEVALVDKENIALAQRVIKFRVKNNILYNIFLKYWIISSGFQFFLQSLSTGSTAEGIKASKIFMLPLVLPPLPEQQRIAAYLDEKCARIDTLLAEKDELLDKLAEYKKSLIFECVTGKREVAA